MHKKILVIDNDESAICVIKKALEPFGYEIVSKTTINACIKALDKFKLILLDLMLPDGNSIEALNEIKVFNPNVLVVIVTAHGRMEGVIDAMREGAYDYLEKPFDIDKLTITVERAFRDITMREELLKLRQSYEDSSSFQIIRKSKEMQNVFKEIDKIALKDMTVLISGESGTGKKLIAKAIHNNSRRKFGSFIAINSASIPKELLEAELFGWEKGAFTGAVKKTVGKIQAATGGTLFFDEIAELDPELQAKILRFIQEREYNSLGSNKVIKADVRIIGATNKDLMECVKAGTFMEDLYYHFNVINIKIPPLRDRKDDILPIARYFLKESIRLFELPPKDFSKDAEKAMSAYDWPENVRELENTVKRAAILSKSRLIERQDIFTDEYNGCSIKEFLEGKLISFVNKMTKIDNLNLYDTIISEVEKALFSIVLKETKGNQVKASKVLGINRNTLNKKIRGYKLI